LIVVVVDGEIAGKSDGLRFAAQQPRAKGMKGRDPNVERAAAARAQEFADSFLHHAGGLVGERDGKNRAGWHALLDQMRDAIGDHARLARACAREDEQRSFGCKHGFALAFVQSGDQRNSLGRIAQA